MVKNVTFHTDIHRYLKTEINCQISKNAVSEWLSMFYMMVWFGVLYKAVYESVDRLIEVSWKEHLCLRSQLVTSHLVNAFGLGVGYMADHLIFTQQIISSIFPFICKPFDSGKLLFTKMFNMAPRLYCRQIKTVFVSPRIWSRQTNGFPLQSG